MAAIAGWQGSAGQKVSMVGSLAVGLLKNFRCLAAMAEAVVFFDRLRLPTPP